ncbi:unnamed protein product [Absidia cylindrospora]
MTEFILRASLKGHNDAVTCIVASAENPKRIVSGSRDKSLLVWRMTRDESNYGAPQKSLLGHNHFIQDIAMSSDGMYVLSASWDKTLRLWELATGKTIRRFDGHGKDVLSVAFSPDNRQIATGSRDRTVKLWNTLGDCKASVGQDMNGHTEWVSCVRFSPDPARPFLVTCGWDKSVKVWDMNKFSLAVNFTGHNGYVSKLALSPDGSLCASGGKDGVVMLWDMQENKHLYSLEVNNEVYDLAFCPAKTWLAVACGSLIHIWDVETKKDVAIVRVDSGFTSGKALPIQTLSLAWSADGATLYSGQSNGLIQVWTYTSTL